VLLFLFQPGEEAPSSPHHHFYLDGVRRGRSSSRCRFLFHCGEEGLPLLFTSSFPFRRDEEGLPLLFMLLFPFRRDEEGLPLLFMLLFLFRELTQQGGLPSFPRRHSHFDEEEVYPSSLYSYYSHFDTAGGVPPHYFNICNKISVYKLYLVDFTPGLLKPITCTHKTRTCGHGYGFPQVRVRVQLEIPRGYPCHSLISMWKGAHCIKTEITTRRGGADPPHHVEMEIGRNERQHVKEGLPLLDMSQWK